MSGSLPHVFQPMQQLTAAQLNDNFLFLLGLAATALAQSETPDPAIAVIQGHERNIDRELARLRTHVTQSSRLRNEKQYAPAATVAALYKQLQELAGPVRARMEALDGVQTALTLNDEATEARLTALEHAPVPPAAPTMAEFAELQAELREAQRVAKEAMQHAMQAESNAQGFIQRLQRAERQPQQDAAVPQLARRVEAMERRPTLASQHRLLERVEAIEQHLAKRQR
jgi:hypothetical protein